MRTSNEARRPVLRSWPAVYTVVILSLAAVIVLLYLFTVQFR